MKLSQAIPNHLPPPVGSIHLIPVSSIRTMQGSPFGIREDASMQELTESITQFGVLHPIEVRPISDDGFQLISGARRIHACQSLGLDTIPAIVLDLDDDEAIIRMVDSNIQREYLLPSERAYAYKMRLEAMKRKAGRRSISEAMISSVNLPESAAIRSVITFFSPG